MTPSERYQHDLQSAGFSADPAQLAAVAALDRVHAELERPAPARGRPSGRLVDQRGGRFLRRKKPQQQAIGLYMWGGVGRGKTWLMDAFYDCLESTPKQRQHFHHFMRGVHQELGAHRNRQNPLEDIARKIRQQTRVICFDEFFVSDITDAMILGTLFEALFRHGITLIATSNIPPELLYKDGLQRARFLPTIDALQQHCEVLNVDGGTDYRLRQLQRSTVYQTPAGTAAEAELSQYFLKLSDSGNATPSEITLSGRPIPVKARANGVVWFDFSAICDGPRSQHDYIDIASCHHTVLISNVPKFDASLENQARRFINMVDEFYDQRVNLILSAEMPLEQLYQGQKVAFEFERTASRLLEMQSKDYLASPHLA